MRLMRCPAISGESISRTEDITCCTAEQYSRFRCDAFRDTSGGIVCFIGRKGCASTFNTANQTFPHPLDLTFLFPRARGHSMSGF